MQGNLYKLVYSLLVHAWIIIQSVLMVRIHHFFYQLQGIFSSFSARANPFSRESRQRTGL